MAELEALYRAHHGFIFKYLLSLCRDESLAEELTQETFYRAYINLKQLRDDAKAAAWLCGIARNLYFAEYHRRRRQTPLAEQPDERDPAAAVEAKCLARDAIACLAALEEPYREVFELHILGEVPLARISALFGKSESWARVTYYRAKEKILERMKSNEV